MGHESEHRPFRLTPRRPGERVMVMTVLVGLMLMTILLGLAGSCPQGHPQKNSRRAVCKSNLRQIALACQIYADDNDDRFPDDLSQLGPEYLKSVKANPKVFLCPSAADRKTSSYTLVPGLHADMPGSFILAYEPLEDHRGQGRNVAYVDTRVVWTLAGKPGEFEAELAKQREAARNWKPPEKAKQR